MKNLTGWPRLAAAACDARDELRGLLPELSAAIATAPTPLLLKVRALAIRNAEALRLALKAPARPRARRGPRAKVEVEA